MTAWKWPVNYVRNNLNAMNLKHSEFHIQRNVANRETLRDSQESPILPLSIESL